MATAPDEQASKKPRKSLIRSLSWKQPSKRTKMEEGEQSQFEASIEEVDSGRSVTTIPGTAHGMSDEDVEDETFYLDSTASSSKKRKKSGVWKAVKRFFSRRSSKGSKSFTAGDARKTHGQPQKSLSDPNLLHRSGERPVLAPLEQLDETPMETEVSPKKAISHDNLLSELRLKQRKNSKDPSSPKKKPVPVPKPAADVDWQTSPASTPEQLLPGLNVSHDKIRVAPRHRRAPTRKGIASVRYGLQDVTDGQQEIPRSKSVGARVHLEVPLVQPGTSTSSTACMVRIEEGKREWQQNKEEQKNQELEKQELEQEQSEREKLEWERRKKGKLEEDMHKKLEEQEKQRLEQKKLEEEKVEQEKIEQEKLENKKFEQEKLKQEKLEQEKLEQEKLEQENLEQKKMEDEKLKPEKLKKGKHELEKLEQQKLQQERLENEKLEQERLEQEKLEKVEQEKRKQEILKNQKLEKLRIEQEDHEKQMRQQENLFEQEKLEKERLLAEKQKQQEERNNEHNAQQTVDFSDLAESPRPSSGFSDLAESLRLSDDSEETYKVRATEVEIKETASQQQTEQREGDMNIAAESNVTGVTLYQNIVERDIKSKESGTLKVENAPSVLDFEIPDEITADNRQTASDFALSSVLIVESAPPSNQGATKEVEIVELISERSQEPKVISVSEEEDVCAESVVNKQSKTVELSDQKSSEDDTVISADNENNNPSPGSSPVRNKRLVIETPEKVYQKPIMPEVRCKEDRNNEGPKVIQRTQSMHSRIRSKSVEISQSQDDSNAGVAKLTQAFERSTRSKTISCKERPKVLPKPKVPSKPSQSQTLERNYRFPVSKTSETRSPGSPKKRNRSDTVVIVSDKVPGKITEKKENVSSSPARKPTLKPKPLPKLQPKPKVKPRTSLETTKAAEEGKENIKKTPNSQSVTNGSVKVSSPDAKNGGADLPSFWARRSIFSPEQNCTTSLDSSEKTKEFHRHAPIIQLKTDTCAICGSKVYQMEKFKVKDNIVHRSCIKCSVCKRLLSVGNFIMSNNKIYCKPHEPHTPISLTTV